MIGKLTPMPVKRLYWKSLAVLNKPRFPESFGDVFASQWKFLAQSQNWSPEIIRQWQDRKLTELVRCAYENTKFYRRLYDSLGISPDDIKSVADLAKLPVVTKNDIIEHGSEMVNSAIEPHLLHKHTTGGSSGQPVGLWRLNEHDMYIDWAFIYRQWRQAGWRCGDRVLRIRGLTGGRGINGELTVKKLPLEGITVLSAAELTPANYKKFIDYIREFKPVFLELFPSSLRCLCSMILSAGHSVRPVKAIFCESEILTQADRDLARKVWGAEIFSGYGNSERSVDAVECHCHSGYHVNYEYGIVELLDENAALISQPFVEGDIISTGLTTSAMPLIRYNTADRGSWAAGPCRCGRAGQRLATVVGRRQDYLVTSDRRVVSISALNHFQNAGQISQYQFRQSRAGLVEFAYTAASNCSLDKNSLDIKALNNELVKMFCGNIEIEFTHVDSFELSSRGKHRLVVQELDIDSFMSPGKIMESIS